MQLSFLLDNWILTLPPLISLLFTILWIAGIINAFNWLDGIDGLATGVSALSIFFIIISSLYYEFGRIEVLLLASPLLGCCIGFLKHNFFPAKIIMGDGGSYILGFSISILNLLAFNENQILLDNEIIVFNILSPFLILFIPICDMSLVILSRIKSP